MEEVEVPNQPTGPSSVTFRSIHFRSNFGSKSTRTPERSVQAMIVDVRDEQVRKGRVVRTRPPLDELVHHRATRNTRLSNHIRSGDLLVHLLVGGR